MEKRLDVALWWLVLLGFFHHISGVIGIIDAKMSMDHESHGLERKVHTHKGIAKTSHVIHGAYDSPSYDGYGGGSGGGGGDYRGPGGGFGGGSGGGFGGGCGGGCGGSGGGFGGGGGGGGGGSGGPDMGDGRGYGSGGGSGGGGYGRGYGRPKPGRGYGPGSSWDASHTTSSKVDDIQH